nr:hypothetical protein [Tanacetum cinerariifolium]
ALPTIADEPASPMRDDSQGEACPTNSSFIADQDRETIAKSSTLPCDSAPRVTFPAAEEGRRSNNEGEAAVERISNDSEEIARVLTSMDAATVLAGETNVPTGSGFIPTAGPPANVISTGSEVGPTASPIVRRRKGKEVMVESDTPKKKKLQEQIDAQKREYYMAVIKSNLGWRFKDFKGMTFEEIEAKFVQVWKRVEDFIPMGSKEEAERLKRKGINLEKEQV